MSTSKEPATKPSAATCTANGHEISRYLLDCKDGVVEADCWCWTCTYHWLEFFKLERVEEEKLSGGVL